MRFILFLLLGFTLSACGHTPVMTMYKMRNFDINTTDASYLRAAVRYPDVVLVKPGKVTLAFQYWKKGDQQKIDEKFVLEELTSDREIQQLSSFQKPGYNIKVYKVADKDMSRVEMLRRNYKEFKKQNKGSQEASMSVGAEACRKQETTDPIYVSTYFKSIETGSYVVLVDELDIMQLAKTVDISKVAPLCKE